MCELRALGASASARRVQWAAIRRAIAVWSAATPRAAPTGGVKLFLGGKGELSDQVSRENPASRGTETSGELSKYCKVTYGAEEK